MEHWFMRLRRLWMTRLHPEPACVLDGHAMVQRKRVAHLAEATKGWRSAVVLLLDHQHPDAMKTLDQLRASNRESFEAGAIVVGVENLQAAQQAQALASYRRVAQAPVFAVDLQRAADRLLLQEALVATRVAAAFCRDPAHRSPHLG